MTRPPVSFALAAAALVATAACRPRPFTPLAAAAAAGDVTAVKRLVAAGADPEGHDERQGWTPLMWAAREGRPLTIRTLVDLGANPNTPDSGPNHWTPLLHAIHKNQAAAVDVLLQLGADPDLGAVDGPTPLIAAAGRGYAPVLRALLAAGADPRKQSGAVSPLSAAVGTMPDIGRFTTGQCQTETVRILLEAAPDLTIQDAFINRVEAVFLKLRNCDEVLGMVKGRTKAGRNQERRTSK
jgi:ankyrin repeat protein